jgi:aminopeptidase N
MNSPVTFLSRDDYQPFPWSIPRIHLAFDLDAECTRVTSTLELEGPGGELVLDGRALELLALSVDGQTLPPGRWCHEPEQDRLVIRDLPARCRLELVTACRPVANTALEGLYTSGGSLVTQCEAHGFRCITFFPDRPDVPSRFTVVLRADKGAFPVLLANGDLVEQQDLENGRHQATWVDPHPKPCYLFALVAGDLGHVEDFHTTPSGRRVRLRVYADSRNLGKCGHALASLKRAMLWDEQHYGLEYDLNDYTIVAVADFNAGAMENKGLNIFNAQAVLASPATTIDDRFLYVERVVGHEYFHNWSGNRVTLRDWFQLTLKEGLTILRDQEFTADTHSRPLKRIEDVQALRERQFPEDNGPPRPSDPAGPGGGHRQLLYHHHL